MTARAQRYTAVAIVLHWAIATAILFMIPMGLWMHESAEHGDVSASLFCAYQLHKSIGLTVLALSLVRLGWRLANPPLPMPEHMPAWERFIAKATHWAFYALMIGLPLSGWLYVSAGWSIHAEAPLPVATHWFGLFQVPSLFGLNQADLGVREDTAEAALTAHAYLAYAALGLAALHVLAALKHQLFDKDEVLAHMVPGLRAPFETEPAPKNPARLMVLGVGLSIVVIALAAASFALLSGGSAATSPQAQSSFEVVRRLPRPPRRQRRRHKRPSLKNYAGYDKSKYELLAMKGVLARENSVALYAYEKFLKPILLITYAYKNSPARLSPEDKNRLLDLLVSLSLLYIEYLYLRINDLSIGGKMVERIQGLSKGNGLDAALLKKLNSEFGSRALVIKIALEKTGLNQLSYPVFDETNLNN